MEVLCLKGGKRGSMWNREICVCGVLGLAWLAACAEGVDNGSPPVISAGHSGYTSGQDGSTGSSSTTAESGETVEWETTSSNPTSTSGSTAEETDGGTSTGSTTGEEASTTANDPTTTGSTTEDGSSSSSSGGEENDPQPEEGLYSDCAGVDDTCSGEHVCYGLTLNGDKVDGYCTLFCGGADDCLPEPMSGAKTACITAGEYEVCALACNATSDCPGGMTCEPIEGGSYCW